MAKHKKRGQHVRQLIDRRSREAILRVQRAREQWAHQHRAQVVHGGIALIDGNRVATELALHAYDGVVGERRCTRLRFFATVSNAWSQPIGTKLSPSRRSGVFKRSGS